MMRRGVAFQEDPDVEDGLVGSDRRQGPGACCRCGDDDRAWAQLVAIWGGRACSPGCLESRDTEEGKFLFPQPLSFPKFPSRRPCRFLAEGARRGEGNWLPVCTRPVCTHMHTHPRLGRGWHAHGLSPCQPSPSGGQHGRPSVALWGLSDARSPQAAAFWGHQAEESGGGSQRSEPWVGLHRGRRKPIFQSHL